MRAQNTSSIGLFYKSVGMLWTASDCEELVGLLTVDDEGLFSVGVTPLSWYDVPEALEVRVLPSEREKLPRKFQSLSL